jgi:hypothetical protein
MEQDTGWDRPLGYCRRYYSSTFPIIYSLTAYHIPFSFADAILFGLRRKQGRFSKMSDGLGISAAKHHRSSTVAPLRSGVRYLDEAGAAEYLLISPRTLKDLRMKHGGHLICALAQVRAIARIG